MRLFCGLPIPYEVRRNLELLLQHLKPLADIRWSPAENFHITTRFIGEFPDEQIEQIKSALREIPRPDELKISVRGLGWLPSPEDPKIFLAGVESNHLADFAQNVNLQLASIGIKKKTTPYLPHVTLARISSTDEISALEQAIQTLPSTDFGAFTATRHLLYRSRLTPRGSIYSVESDFSLV